LTAPGQASASTQMRMVRRCAPYALAPHTQANDVAEAFAS